MRSRSLGRLMARSTTDKRGQMGICEYLGLVDVTPHDLRRTGACILEQLGYSDGVIGKVMTHKAADKEAAPVTRDHYLVPVPIIARPVDPRVKALDDLDAALREILGLPGAEGSARAAAIADRRLITPNAGATPVFRRRATLAWGCSRGQFSRCSLEQQHARSPLLVRMHPLVGRDLARLGELDHVHGRRVACIRHDRHFKIYGATFAAGPPDNAKVSDVLEHLNET